MSTPPASLPLHELFLGPHGENAPLLTRLVTEVVGSNASWRDDGSGAAAWPGGVAEHELTVAARELSERLAATYPFHAQHWVAHQQSDVMLGSYLGVLAGTLSNGNIVANESSPAGIALEFEAGRQVLEMLGYPLPPLPEPSGDHQEQYEYQEACKLGFAWAHLLSGGSAANMEALWLARLVAYLPIRVQAAARVLGLDVKINGTGIADKLIADLDVPTLLGMGPTESLEAYDALKAAVLAGEKDKLQALDESVRDAVLLSRSTRRVELALDHPQVHTAAREAMQEYPPVILAPGTAHYSVEKSADVLGIGRDAVWPVGVDTQFRMDIDDLRTKLDDARTNKKTVIAVIVVIGTTEEGAVDPLKEIIEVRGEVRRGFWIHADAAWGGYLTSLLRTGPLQAAIAGQRTRLAQTEVAIDPDASDAGWVNELCMTIESHIPQLTPPPATPSRRRLNLLRKLPAVDDALLVAPDAGRPEHDRIAAINTLSDFIVEMNEVQRGVAVRRPAGTKSDTESESRRCLRGALDTSDAVTPYLHDQLWQVMHADSITIDPHKLGHTAYPAGLVCFNDDRVRDVMAVKAPYISRDAGSQRHGQGRLPIVHVKDGKIQIGSPNAHTLEGSRPASAAASVWLTHRVLPLRRDGHGRLMANHLSHARRLWEELGKVDFGHRKIITFMPLGPDSNLVLFIGYDPTWAASIDQLNEFNDELFALLQQPATGFPKVNPPDGTAFVSQTELGPKKYPFASFGSILDHHRVPLTEDQYTADEAPQLKMLRAVCADPYLCAPGSDRDPVTTVVEHITNALVGVG